MQQIIICQECPYFKAKCKDKTLYCKMTKKRCIELNQYKGYTIMLKRLKEDLRK